MDTADVRESLHRIRQHAADLLSPVREASGQDVADFAAAVRDELKKLESVTVGRLQAPEPAKPDVPVPPPPADGHAGSA